MAGTFIRLNPEDFVVSSDSITATIWTGNTPELTTFYTSSVQVAGSSGDFYYNIYQSDPSSADDAEIQFAIAYGNKQGSGSSWYNNAVAGASPTRSTYGQYRTLILGDENSEFIFGNVTSSDFWVISLDRTRYKQSLFPGSMTLLLSGSSGTISLTDNSQYVSSIVFNDAGRVYQLISGSAGTGYFGSGVDSSTGYSPSSGSYGYLLPDIGTILLNPLALSQSIGLVPNRSSNSDGLNYQTLYNAIKGAQSFRLNSQETISSDYIFIRAKNAEFNYTENPSFISGSTGELVYSSFINNPQTYPTTIGLYNDNNELLAVAKLSRPLLKDFTKEALVRVKIDF